MSKGKTIAAVATPSGEGGIGVVRISGDDAFTVADKIFTSQSGRKLSEAAGYTALFGHLHDADGKAIDECIALCFRAPRSYTGENTVELSVHGGEYVVSAVLRAAIDAGAVPAQRGEFTKRAFLNGKMDLSEAEAVMDIISAADRQALDAGLRAHEGAVSEKCLKIKDDLKFAAATVAAFSDFPDEEPEFSGIDRLCDMLHSAADELSRLIADYDTGRMIRNGIGTVIIGPPNAGKSTLMNRLAGYERSIVTSIPGTTRDTVEETVRFGGVTLRLCDTAGLRDTSDPVEKIGVERTKKSIKSADLILVVVDGSEEMPELCEIDKMTDGKPSVIVCNKSDIKCGNLKNAGGSTSEIVFVSAKTGDGMDELAKAIKRATAAGHIDGTAGVYLNERQRDCAVRAAASVHEAINALDSGITVDAVGVLIDEALAALLELTGERVTEEVANEVFSKFCVGK